MAKAEPETKQTAEKRSYIPEWMVPYGIKSKDWLSMAKKQLRSQMRPDRPLKVQVWACGMLHTAGYQGELARTMVRTKDGSKIVNLTPAIIIGELYDEAVAYYKSAGVEETFDEVVREDGSVDKVSVFARLKETKEDIRSAIQELERDGVCDRRAGGSSIRTMTPEQLRRLPSGRIEYHFYLEPKAANPETVGKQWAALLEPAISSADMSKVEVGIPSLPPIPISQVLKVFGVERPGLKVFTSPEYHEKVCRGWLAAKKIFLEVVNGSLPQVGEPEGPQVGAAAGAFEHIREQDVERPSSSSKVVVEVDPGKAATTTKNGPPPGATSIKDGAPPEPPIQTGPMPDAEFTERLVAIFIDASRPSPSPKQARDLADSLPSHPVARVEFLAFLCGKMRRIKHAGVLPSVAGEFRLAWPAILDKVEAEKEAAAAEVRRREEINQRVLEEIRSRWDQVDSAERAELLEIYPELAGKAEGAS